MITLTTSLSPTTTLTLTLTPTDLSQRVYPEQDAQGASNGPRPREAFLGPRHAEVNRVRGCEVVQVVERPEAPHD